MGLQRKGMTVLDCGMVDMGFLNFCYNLFCSISCARNYISILHPFTPDNITTAFTGGWERGAVDRRNVQVSE